MRQSLTCILISCLALAVAACDDDSKSNQDQSVDVDVSDAGDTDTGDVPDIDIDTIVDDVADFAPDTTPCTPVLTLELRDGLFMEDGCGSQLTLLPYVHIGGQRVGGGTCAGSGSVLTCTVAGQGDVLLTIDPTTGSLTASFVPTNDVAVEGLELEATGTLSGANAWLSNGFQSWSMSGVVALQPAPAAEDLALALAAEGDTEVLRDGTHQLSWFHSWIGGTGPTVFAGAMAAAAFKPWVQASLEDDQITIRLVSGLAGESVSVTAGTTLHGEPWMVAMAFDTAELNQRLQAYGENLGSTPGAAEAGWNSWYELWDSVDENAIRANAVLAQSTLTPLLPTPAPVMRVVVDDGWQLLWGEWTPNAKFPSGMNDLVTWLQGGGMEAGVWLAPLLVDEDSQLVADNPDWFVPGLVYNHQKNGPMRVLDVTHPDAADHLRTVISTIVGWGFDLLKIDFLFAGSWEGNRFEDVTGMQAYARALQIIREAAGPDVLLLAVGAPGLPSLPYVDSWRLGWDIALEPFDASWPFVVDQARSISARWPLCFATLCDADPPLLRTLPQNEVEFGLEVVALSGGAFFLSDDLPALPSERLAWVDLDHVARSVAGTPAIPSVVFPTVPPRTLTNGGVAHVIGFSDAWVPPIWTLQDGRTLRLNSGEAPTMVGGVEVPARTVVIE